MSNFLDFFDNPVEVGDIIFLSYPFVFNSDRKISADIVIVTGLTKYYGVIDASGYIIYSKDCVKLNGIA